MGKSVTLYAYRDISGFWFLSDRPDLKSDGRRWELGNAPIVYFVGIHQPIRDALGIQPGEGPVKLTITREV